MIYFIQGEMSKAIKIGFAKRPADRLSVHQVSCSEKLALIGVAQGTKDDEAKIHEQFADCWIRGEWFLPSERLVEFIQSLPPYLVDKNSRPRRLNIRSTRAINSALKEEAARQHTTVQDLVITAIIHGLNRHDLLSTLET